MTNEYYILSGKGQSGPYDLVAIVRKIRNGTVLADTQIQTAGGEAKPAQEWAELGEFFLEKKDEKHSVQDRAGAHQQYDLGSALQKGLHFLQRNQYTTVFSGLMVLVIILLGVGINVVLPPSLRVLAYIACFIFAHFMLSCYMLSVLRMGRGQPIDAMYLKSKISPAVKSLFISSLFVCIPAIVGVALLTTNMPEAVVFIGLFILALPGLFSLALYSFTPLLIMDKGLDFWDAMETSRKSVMTGGLEKAGVIYALFVINFLGALCVLLPLAITLPITIGALAEMYDESFG